MPNSVRSKGGHRRPAAGMIHPVLFYGLAGFLLLTNGLSMMGVFMAPDIARLVNGQNDRVYDAYEDRIDQLRLEVDRLHSRQYAQAGNLNLQLQELAQQQDVLLEQHSYVRALVDKAAELGIDTAMVADSPPDEPAIGQVSFNDVDEIQASVDSMMGESRVALAGLSESVTLQTDAIVSELEGVGIEPSLPEPGFESVGGPFLPAKPGDYDESSLVDDANAVIAALDRFKAARSSLDMAPVRRPTVADFRISSGFGNRRDPFLGKLAFHSGMDFAAPYGTPVLSAGPGRVIFAGVKSGYGNAVDVQHEDGLVTRYAHMSRIAVSDGDEVPAGFVLGFVGSTGRSTGAHLHFEVRRNDSAINPSNFLKAGRRLARFL